MSDPQVGMSISIGVDVWDTSTPPVLANVGSGPTCAITQPDGTAATATVTNPSTGVYTATLAAAPQAGQYQFLWSAGGANSAGLNQRGVDVVNVWPSNPRFLLPLQTARDALNLTSGNTVHDDEIMLYIAAATDVIEDICGPILSANETRTFDGYEPSLLLPDKPATITSITEKGVTLTENTDFIVDYQNGILHRVLSDGSPRAWGSYYQPTFIERSSVVVTYTVGSGVIPPAALMAAAEEVRFLYQTSQQGSGFSRPTFGQDDTEMAWTPSGFAVPRMVIELCQPLAAKQRFLGVL